MDSKPDIALKPKLHLLLASLPDYLKNPANYLEVQKKILKTVYSNCGHSELLDWSKCSKCTNKMLERRKLLKKLGFKHPAQYMLWRRVHEEIKKRMPLVKWKKQI